MRREDLFEELEPDASPEEGEQEEDASHQLSSKLKQKTFLPQEYHKAKRTLNKIVLQYFNHLKEEVSRGGKLFLNRSRLDGILTAITYYVGLRYHDKPERM